jgi:hypothetical protein
MSDDELKQQLKRVLADSLRIDVDSEPGGYDGCHQITVSLFLDDQFIGSGGGCISTN